MVQSGRQLVHGRVQEPPGQVTASVHTQQRADQTDHRRPPSIDRNPLARRGPAAALKSRLAVASTAAELHRSGVMRLVNRPMPALIAGAWGALPIRPSRRHPFPSTGETNTESTTFLPCKTLRGVLALQGKTGLQQSGPPRRLVELFAPQAFPSATISSSAACIACHLTRRSPRCGVATVP